MILGSPAQTAGVEQGDQVLQIDSIQVDGQSPFQAASSISGGDAEEGTTPEPIVHLQVKLSVHASICTWFWAFCSVMSASSFLCQRVLSDIH